MHVHQIRCQKLCCVKGLREMDRVECKRGEFVAACPDFVNES